ncbi:MAG: glycoside hydrolase family 97 N-terminal domain-containing protein, partial [Verrucomicrobiales bacterium]|nr:glycoside hydrolase family 97 N-terminal domain-containing protein [Verrucomicrobiales bacterium]
MPTPEIPGDLIASRCPDFWKCGIFVAIRSWRLCMGLLTLSSAVSGAFAQPIVLDSPDSRIHVAINLPAPDSAATPSWSASFQGEVLFTNCHLSLQTAQAGDLMSGIRVLKETRRTRNQRIQVLHGRSKDAEDRFNEARFQFATAGGHRTVVVFRCYNDAIALRYELPAGGTHTSVTITNEATSFCPTGDPIGHIQYLENFKTSHEHNVTSTEFSRIRKGELLDMPLTLAWKDGTYAAITEAALRRYAGMSLTRGAIASNEDSLICALTPRADGSKVFATLPLETPWRVVLLAERSGALLESSTLYCLNSPSEIGNTSWIRPGKITFHWWNGDVYDGQPGTPMLSFAMNKKYIDFCSREGILTHSITSTEGVTT